MLTSSSRPTRGRLGKRKIKHVKPALLEVRPQHSYYLIQVLAALLWGNVIRPKMFAEVSFQHLRHQPVHSTPDRGDLLENCRAI